MERSKECWSNGCPSRNFMCDKTASFETYCGPEISTEIFPIFTFCPYCAKREMGKNGRKTAARIKYFLINIIVFLVVLIFCYIAVEEQCNLSRRAAALLCNNELHKLIAGV